MSPSEMACSAVASQEIILFNLVNSANSTKVSLLVKHIAACAQEYSALQAMET